MEREACVCDHGFERSDLCAEIIIIINNNNNRSTKVKVNFSRQEDVIPPPPYEAGEFSSSGFRRPGHPHSTPWSCEKSKRKLTSSEHEADDELEAVAILREKPRPKSVAPVVLLVTSKPSDVGTCV